MDKSETIKELATALNKAQAEMSGAVKNSKSHYSTYADLFEVIQCIKEPFADNGLSYSQFPLSDDGKAGVETILMHSSGEWISNTLMLKCQKNDPQGLGSAITYARRFSLQSIAGIPSVDDDAELATKVVLVTKEQNDILTNMCRSKKLNTKQVNPLLAHYNIARFSELAADKYEEVIKAIEGIQ